MSNYKDLLERERRRFAMPDGSLEGLERRRNRKRRNAQILAGVLALLIAAAGVGGGLYAFRGGTVPRPAGRTPSPTPSPAPRNGQAGPSSVSGPIQFIDDQHGWMVDADGQILATSDGGHRWNVQLSGPSNIKAIDFVDSEHGWAVGDGGLIQTTDGGAHWVTWSNQPLSSIQFMNPKTGWGVAASTEEATGSLLKTTDGGRTWSDVQTPNQIESVCFADSLNGWAAGGISLLRTTNGGQSWTGGPLTEFPQGEPWTATVRCTSNGKEAFILLQDGGAAGHIAYVAWQATDDGQGGYSVQFVLQEAGTHPLGSSSDWYDSEDPYPGPFTFVAPGMAYFMNWCPQCQSPTVHLTKASGVPAFVTDRLPVPSGDLPVQPVGVSFVSEDHGWVLLRDVEKNSTLVLRTSDGGQTWEQP